MSLIVNNVTITDSVATPANTFYALNSTDNGNNTNWTFRTRVETPVIFVENLTIKDAIGEGANWSSPHNCGNIDAGNNFGFRFSGKDFISSFSFNIPIF